MKAVPCLAFVDTDNASSFKRERQRTHSVWFYKDHTKDQNLKILKTMSAETFGLADTLLQK